jgi:hypothetical protein
MAPPTTFAPFTTATLDLSRTNTATKCSLALCHRNYTARTKKTFVAGEYEGTWVHCLVLRSSQVLKSTHQLHETNTSLSTVTQDVTHENSAQVKNMGLGKGILGRKGGSHGMGRESEWI